MRSTAPASQLQHAFFTTALALSCAPATSFADTRLTIDSLPDTLTSADHCLDIGADGWGWDGERSCRVSIWKLRGAPFPLTRAYSNPLAWSREDVANKTVRCDSYNRNYLPSTELSHAYNKDTYDITFLTEDTIPASASQESLTDVTGHMYSRGWEIGQYGRLNTGLLANFNTNTFSTAKGYIFVYDRYSSPKETLVNSFAHCYLRDEDAPLRASGYCVDFDGDGVGWNGREACDVPPVDPNCDYSNASRGYNSGWGHNTVTGDSCPPVGNTSTYVANDQCKKSGRDGWGWNEAQQQTCRIDE